jgi:hypothetical protein
MSVEKGVGESKEQRWWRRLLGRGKKMYEGARSKEIGWLAMAGNLPCYLSTEQPGSRGCHLGALRRIRRLHYLENAQQGVWWECGCGFAVYSRRRIRR